MNKSRFVDAIQVQVRDSAVESVLTNVKHPPGRRPDAALLELSSWFLNLAPGDKAKVQEVVRMTSQEATFGFLAVLDGVRPIEDREDKGHLRLVYVRGDESTVLNDSNDILMHDLLRDS